MFSLILRAVPVMLAGFPVNDGGMFYVMIRDLKANHFLLPAFTTYNDLQIPYAYPPLGFYLAGLISLAGIPELFILRWLPGFISLVSIPAFYHLAETLLKDRLPAAIATLFFAMLPGSFDWLIMGGGLTRSFGVLFFILALDALLILFKVENWKFVVPSILFCSLAVLSHPEISLATAASCALIWVFFGRSWKKSGMAMLVALGTVLVTSIWWGTILAYHGLTPFLSVIRTGAYGSSIVSAIYNDFLSPLSILTLLGLLRMGGIVWSIVKKQYFLIAWLLLPYFTEPRSASGMAGFAGAILIAMGLTWALPALIQLIRSRFFKKNEVWDYSQSRIFRLLLLGVMLFFFAAGTLHDFSLANTSLKPPIPQMGMDWVRQNTKPDSPFIILTGNVGIMTDPIQEWFPALAERRSQTTMQGLEWTLAGNFFPRLNELMALQQCETVGCVEAWRAQTGLPYGYVMIRKSEQTQGLLDSYLGDKSYSLVYENAQYDIFSK